MPLFFFCNVNCGLFLFITWMLHASVVFCNVNCGLFLFITWMLHASVVFCNQIFLIKECMLKYMGFIVLFFYRGIELGIESRGISLVLVSTISKCLVSWHPYSILLYSKQGWTKAPNTVWQRVALTCSWHWSTSCYTSQLYAGFEGIHVRNII